MPESARLESVSKEFEGVLATPKSESGPGLLLVHAWWELNDFFRTLAARFGEAGFVTLAPDYYGGRVADTVEQANALRGRMNAKNTERLLAKAADFLRVQSGVNSERIGVVGFSLGAYLALAFAHSKAEVVGAVVLFYGVAGGTFTKFKIPVQGHFAENPE
jgi:carboxymethylenebutenolidase